MDVLNETTESSKQRNTADTNAAFIRLIEEYRPALHRLITGYAITNPDREDLFQEIALSLWRALPNFRGESSERTWLYRIAHNIAITASTKRRGRATLERPTPSLPDVPAPTRGGEQTVLIEEKRSLLEEAVQHLAPCDRQIVLLYLEGVSHSEMEDITGIAKDVIATRLSRARTKLTAAIQQREAR